MHLFLIRHAETNWNNLGKIQGDLDIGLSIEGHKQCIILKERFKENDFDFIYSSDLRRAVETAEYLTRKNEDRIILDDRLRERDYGKWKGLTWDEVKSSFPEEYKIVKENPVNGLPTGGETLKQVEKRINAFFQDLLQNMGKKVVIVSHNSPLMVLLAKAQNLPLEQIRKINYLYNTEVIELEIKYNENHILKWNVNRSEPQNLAFREKII